MDPVPPPIPSQAKGNWWTRNWKWLVPTGCLTIAILFVAFVFSIVLLVFGTIKSTDVYKGALVRAKANPEVIETLGTPIKDRLFVSGNTNVNGATGVSNLSIPISGPNGKATIYVKAEKSLGRWTYSELVVEIQKTGERIDLLKSPSAE